MVMVLLLELLVKLSNKFRSLSIRIMALYDASSDMYVQVYEEYLDPEKIQI